MDSNHQYFLHLIFFLFFLLNTILSYQNIKLDIFSTDNNNNNKYATVAMSYILAAIQTASAASVIKYYLLDDLVTYV